jgi:flagellar hook capping protein FlgD
MVCASGSVTILYGGPDGSLSAPVTLPGPLTNCQTICIGDVTRDGYLDIVANDGGTYYVYRGTPINPFNTFTATTLPFSASDLQVAYAAGDATPYVYALSNPSKLDLLSVSPVGVLADLGTKVVSASPVGLSVGDMNRDGVVDVVSTGQGGSVVTVNLHGFSVWTGVETPPPAVAAHPILRQNYPNPFNPETTIRYALPKADRVNLRVFDIAGRLVASLEDGPENAGDHTVAWDGRTRAGASAGSGVYYYRLTTSSGFSESRQMVLMR